MVMKEKEIFNQAFASRLKGDGFLVEDIEQDICMDQRRKPSPARVVRRWTGFPNDVIRQGLFNETRDALQPKIGQAVLQILQPWSATTEDQGLPVIRVKEITRRTSIPAGRVIDVLSRYPFSFSINGTQLQTAIASPEFPEEKGQKLTLNDCVRYGVSPKRVVRAVRYESRSPGGGPVQKVGIQERRIDPVLREFARENTMVTFTLRQEIETPKRKAPAEIPSNERFFYFFESKGMVVRPDEIARRIMNSLENGAQLILFVPWGVRPEGEPNLEEAVMDRLQTIEANLRQKGVNARILIMPADIYATEVNNQVDPSMVAAYFDYVTQQATERGFAIKPWSEIRAENLIDYQTRAKELTDEAIRVLVGVKKMEMAIETAIKRSGYTTLDDVENAALAYLRERIIEAEIIESLYRPVKVSVVAKNRDDIIDGDLPRIYLFPPELQFPWLK